MTTFNSVERLRNLLKIQGKNSFIFNCTFFDLTITGIYFMEADTLLISFPNLKVAWQTYLINRTYLNSFLPKDIYIKIQPILKSKTDNKPEPIYTAIDNYFGQFQLIRKTTKMKINLFSLVGEEILRAAVLPIRMLRKLQEHLEKRLEIFV